jgi:hypothetical protein
MMQLSLSSSISLSHSMFLSFKSSKNLHLLLSSEALAAISCELQEATLICIIFRPLRGPKEPVHLCPSIILLPTLIFLDPQVSPLTKIISYMTSTQHVNVVHNAIITLKRDPCRKEVISNILKFINCCIIKLIAKLQQLNSVAT